MSNSKSNRTADDCPNCWGEQTDNCPHLLEGDTCPNCGGELTKPPAGKVECPQCRYVINGQRNGVVGSFNLTEREAQRLLGLFGYDSHGTLGTLENRLRRLCDDNDIEVNEFKDVMKDITGRYSKQHERSTE